MSGNPQEKAPMPRQNGCCTRFLAAGWIAVLMLVGGPRPARAAVCGDVTGDGHISIADAVQSLRIALGLERADADAIQGACGHAFRLPLVTHILDVVVGGSARVAPAFTQALWAWPSGGGAGNEVADPLARKALVDLSKASGVDALFVSVYQPDPNVAGRRMYPEPAIADLIDRAHTDGIEVWAAYGTPEDAAAGCADNAGPMRAIAEVTGYNHDHPSAPFDGVMWDIEVSDPSAFAGLLSLYDCTAAALHARSMKVGAAIRFFWDRPIEYPTGGATRPLYQHILARDLDRVVVMGYRNYAGHACPDNGIVCLDQDEIAYADGLSKPGFILAGLETGKPGGDPPIVTFDSKGQAGLNGEASQAVRQLASHPSFGGFAINSYRHAYLSGLAGWPEVNPAFPEE